MKKINLGLIGCGIAAQTLHWPALKKLKNRFEIHAVCNHSSRKGRKHQKLTRAKEFYEDYRDLLKDDQVEAVVIALPIHLNYQVVKESIKRGKHVFVEKPLAANRSEAKRLINLEKKTDLITMVGENFRYRPDLNLFKKLLDQNRLGDVYAANWSIGVNMTSSTSIYAKSVWRQEHQYPGGFLTDGGVHYVHALRYLFGPMTRVYARTASVNSQIGELDTINLEIDTEAGILISLKMYYSSPGHSDNRLVVHGNKATADLVKGGVEVKRGPRKRKLFRARQQSPGYREEFENFHQAITIGKPVRTSFEECYEDLNVLFSAYRSADGGKPVSLKSS